MQGPTFPSLSAFIVPWYPVEQRGRLCSIGYIGISAGGALANVVSGFLLHHLRRWDVVFFLLAAILLVLWILFVSDDFSFYESNNSDEIQCVFHFVQTFVCYEQPKNHPFISDDEREYLQREIADYENERKDLPSTPWMAIIKSSPVLALAISTVIYFNLFFKLLIK